MKNAYEEIRAEHDRPMANSNPRMPYAGLWKQIAPGIMLGYSALSLPGFSAWLAFATFALGQWQFAAS